MSIARHLLPALLAAGAAFAQPAPIRVRVSLGDVSLNKVPFLIADDAGIYKRNGLDVEQTITPAAAEAARRNGVTVPSKYIRGGGSGEPAEIVISGGVPAIVRMVSNAYAPPIVILATTDNEARWKVIARAGITSVAQLKGKRLGYSSYGTVSHYMWIAYVKQLGWDPERDVKLVANALSIEAVRSGRVDAFLADEIAEAMAPAAGLKIVDDLRPYHIPIAGSGITASHDWLDTNREAARRFVKSAVDAIALMKQDRKTAAASLAKWFGITDPEKQQQILAPVEWLPRKPYPSAAGIKNLMQVYRAPEMLRHKAEDFYDASFVRELDETGYIDRLYNHAP